MGARCTLDLHPRPAAHACPPLLAFCFQARRGKALDLLHQGWPAHLSEPLYDPDHALVLARVQSFTEGLVFLYDRRRLHREVLQVGGLGAALKPPDCLECDKK